MRIRPFDEGAGRETPSRILRTDKHRGLARFVAETVEGYLPLISPLILIALT